MTTVLVTGASGFIGRQVLPLLAAAGTSVHGVARSDGRTLASDVKWHRCNLLEEGAARALMREVKPDCLLHLAWIATPGLYWTSPENERWVAASMAMAEAFREEGGRRVVCAGTCAEYDWTSGTCREETTPLVPTTVYGRAKLRLSEALSDWSRACGVSFAWGRIFHLYGPHEHPARLVPSVILSLLAGSEARTTTGTQVRGFLHVSDVASAFLQLALGDAEGPYNLGSDHAIAVKEVVEMIGDMVGARELLRIGSLAANANDPPRLVADNSRLRSLGWSPHWTLRAGLDATIEWWRRQPDSLGVAV